LETLIIRRFHELISRLGLDGHFQKQSEFAELIGEDASGLTSIKTGKKRLRLDHIAKLKTVVPNIDVHWLVTGEGDVYMKDNPQNVVAVSTGDYIPGKRKLSLVIEELRKVIPGEKLNLLNELKTEIDSIVEDRDRANMKFQKALEKMHEVGEMVDKIGK
jgi:hypothetical protein